MVDYKSGQIFKWWLNRILVGILKDKFEWINLNLMTFFETWSTVPNLNEWFIEYEQRNKNIADQKKHLEFLKRENNFLVNCKLYDDV